MSDKLRAALEAFIPNRGFCPECGVSLEFKPTSPHRDNCKYGIALAALASSAAEPAPSREEMRKEIIAELHKDPIGLDGDTHETMLTRFIRLFGADLTNNPKADIEFVEEAGEVYNYGFERAHELRACGHSVGDYRDPNYVIGKPETYTASEACIGCEREAKLLATVSGPAGAAPRLTQEQVRAP